MTPSPARSSRRAVARMLTVSAAVIATVLLSANSTAAMRHLKLLKSFPSADTTLAKSPDAVRLWLTEPAELPATKIELATDAGAAIATAPLTRGEAKDAPVVANIPKPLANGGYKVTWKAMSKDGHVVNGTIAFKVGGPK